MLQNYKIIAVQGDSVALSVRDCSRAAIDVTGLIGTVIFQATLDGSTWQNISDLFNGANAISTTVDGHYSFDVGDFSEIKATVSVLTSGSPTILVAGYQKSGSFGIFGKILADVWDSINHFLKFSLATLIAGEDLTNNKLRVELNYSNFNISTATTTTVKSGVGFVDEILVVGGTLGAITVYDNIAGSGTILCPTVTPSAAGVILKHCTFSTGLTIVTAAATVVTGSYR